MNSRDRLQQLVKSTLKAFREVESLVSLLSGFLLIILAAGLILGLIYWDQRRHEAELADVQPSPTPIITALPTGETEPDPLPVIYQVARGDSSWRIAQAFYGDGQYYVVIEEANDLSANQSLEVGQELLIPKLDGSLVVAPEPGEAPAAIESPAAPETPIALAEPTPTSTPAVSPAVTPSTEVVVSPTPTPAAPEPAEPTTDTTTYTVQTGDSLWLIAERQLGDPYRWSELYQQNHELIGNNPDLIYPETVLTLPADSTPVAQPAD